MGSRFLAMSLTVVLGIASVIAQSSQTQTPRTTEQDRKNQTGTKTNKSDQNTQSTTNQDRNNRSQTNTDRGNPDQPAVQPQQDRTNRDNQSRSTTGDRTNQGQTNNQNTTTSGNRQGMGHQMAGDAVTGTISDIEFTVTDSNGKRHKIKVDENTMVQWGDQQLRLQGNQVTVHRGTTSASGTGSTSRSSRNRNRASIIMISPESLTITTVNPQTP